MNPIRIFLTVSQEDENKITTRKEAGFLTLEEAIAFLEKIKNEGL